ncbi:hypothetical protein Emin_1139 [Elusimicrobium minutum Pei191]|uniref:Uncharacterized protein n=1 Tax=Elusimicrobium minutum (strain Pei191) TaxID=445932 RepID=B2KDU5_ELUMP|nr:hypothetical protein [Elusimicrobium minutum]ACC98691.1 hypothetical protein Emin_1139 [Elusimicrobium minutum Pei191]
MKKPRPKYINIFVISLILLAAAFWYTRLSEKDNSETDNSAEVYLEEENAEGITSSEAFEELFAEGEYAVPSEENSEDVLIRADSTLSAFEGTGIAGVAQKEKSIFDVVEEGEKNRGKNPITLPSLKVVTVEMDSSMPDPDTMPETILPIKEDAELAQERSITMLTAPVDYKIISTAAEYAAFKKTAKGKYPSVDFNKQSVVILESKSNLPDNIFEIAEVRAEGGKDIVDFRVNILGLKNKPESHTYKVVNRKIKKVELNQIL